MRTEIDFHYQLDGTVFTTNDALLKGRDIRSNSGLNPVSEFMLIEVGDQTTRSIGLEETINLADTSSHVFRSFRGDRTYSFTVNERGYEWGADCIPANLLREIAQIPDNHELILDSDHDKPIHDEAIIRLAGKGVERLLSRPPQQICIIINAREFLVDPGRLSFWEIVKLAFPNASDGPNTAYTVSYRKGHGDHPEGTLIAGESVKLKKRMHFNVSETDKS